LQAHGAAAAAPRGASEATAPLAGSTHTLSDESVLLTQSSEGGAGEAEDRARAEAAAKTLKTHVIIFILV
jgi:hypothetical protein